MFVGRQPTVALEWKKLNIKEVAHALVSTFDLYITSIYIANFFQSSVNYTYRLPHLFL